MSGHHSPGALGRPALERLADAALSHGHADEQVEVLATHDWGGLTRFANSAIHQNVVTEHAGVRVRVALTDGRFGVAGAETDQPADVAGVVARARAIAQVAPPDPDFPGLAPAAPVGDAGWDPLTADAGPQHRAAAVRELLAEVPDDLRAAGSYATRGSELLVATSAGQRAYAPGSHAHLTLVCGGGDSSGWAEAGGRSTADADPAEAARRAVAKARRGVHPAEIRAGSWPVVLEPAAVQTLVDFLAWLGFGARDVAEGRSFVAGRLGEALLDPTISLVDDASSPATVGLPFDYEGTPKQRVDLVRGGVLAGVVHDRFTARREGVASTGHGLPAPNPHGPIPLNPVLSPGAGGDTADLVAGMREGLVVTRFHYTNVVHPRETTLTGMTRDGTFLVRDGEVVSGVRNLRFTQSIVEALREVDAVGTQTAFASELFSGSRCPALRLPAFSFTGTTTFG